jgi:hypothetical protein
LKSFAGYFPLNGFSPAPVANRSVHIENIAAGNSYQRVPEIGFPELATTNDSLNISSVAEQLGADAATGRFPIYSDKESGKYNDPLHARRVPLTAAETDQLFFRHDTVLGEENGELVQRTITTPQDPAQYCGFRFYESWDFDPVKMTFTKNIKSVGLLRMAMNNYGEIRGIEMMFCYDHKPATVDSIRKPHYLIGRNILSPVLISYTETNPNENDGGVSIVNYFPTYHEQVSSENRYLLVQQVIDGILAGRIVASPAEERSRRFTPEQFRAMLDTAAKSVSKTLEPGKEFAFFNELTFDEDWYYNPSTRQFYKQVNAVTFGHYTRYGWTLPDGRSAGHRKYFTVKVNGTK